MDDPEFHTALIRALARLVVAHEQGDPERAVAALRQLLGVIAGRGTVETRKSEALARALELS